MRTDSGNINVPIGTGPNCGLESGYAFCSAPYYFSSNLLYPHLLFSYTTATVTPTWQKFSVTSKAENIANNKVVYIGGLGQASSQKIYIWGARLEAAQ